VKTSSKLLPLLLAVVLCQPSLCGAWHNVQGQERQSPKPGRSTAPDDESAEPLKQQALALLYREIDRAKLYNHTKDRIIVWSRIADVIWDTDADKGRQLLRDAYSLVTDAEASEREGESRISLGLRTAALQEMLRSDVLAVAHKHDPKLLQGLLASFKESPKNLSAVHNRPEVFGSSSFQKRALASMAIRLAASEPQKAVDYAIDSLGYGVPQEFGPLFKILADNNRKYAYELFAKTTSIFSNDPSSNLYDAVILSGYLRVIPQPESDTQLVQQFLNSALVRMNNVWKSEQNNQTKDQLIRGALLFASEQLHGFYRAYLPEKVPEVEELRRQVGGPTDAEQRSEGDELNSKGEVQSDAEKILERAEKETNEENRDALYLEAALIISKAGNYPRALDVVARANNLERRAAVITYIRREQAEQLIQQGELFSAAKIVEMIDDPELRVELTVLVARAGNKKSGELARAVLDDTRRLLERNIGSTAHARAYLWLASAYATFEPLLSFDLMTSAVKLANKARDLNDLSAEPKLIHLGGKSNKAIAVGTAKGDFLPGFRLLAPENFSAAESLAESFDSQLLRGLSTVAVNESILAQKTARNR
jgi:hypothetical protein